MTILDVSFGIFAFLPPGWIFMIIVVLLEALVLSISLTKKKTNKRIYLTSLLSNSVSGLIGVISSLLINGGWILVLWLPWVSSHEININNKDEVICLICYYIVAFVLSIGIESIINVLLLQKKYCRKRVVQASLYANAASYAFGTLALIVLLLIPIK
ncbi:MAG: hypothetical protein II475_00950 [Bacteroidales bacterium]|nr:hypothetical protein [Bacteroidales bacterium]MBQ2107236.1 hypothetical protein [Bacteroidales bacterium]MBQ2229891.1 hypothetical protein [Bacteroidales bacterium]MBQ2543513.1 hypothetical protein [Bacteroidales bacterium]MBQ4201906.1 hypothetical protein [Bacteroidales bacterium]